MKRTYPWSTRPKAKPQWFCPACKTARLLTLYVRTERWTKRKEAVNQLVGKSRTKRKQSWIPVGTVCSVCRFPVILDNRVPKRAQADDITIVEGKSTRWIGAKGSKERDTRYDYSKHRRAMDRFYSDWTQEDFERQAESSKKHWRLYSEAMDLYFEMAGIPF